MKLRELHLKNFGKFSDEKIVLQDGVNLFYGENESGKTTVHTFIKSMLFGMERGRGRASHHDTYSQYEPWNQPAYYAGRIRFESGGKIFSLERTFDKYNKSASLICENDGEELSLEHGDLDMLLDGLDMATYENTAFVGQLKAEPNQSLAAQLQNFATNYYTTGNSDMNLDGALSLLNRRKKETEKEMQRMLQEKQQKRTVVEQEGAHIWRDIHKIETELEEIENKLESAEAKKEVLESEEIKKWRVHPGTLAAMLISLIVIFFAFNPPWNYLLVVVLALAYIMFIWNRVKDGRKKPQEELLSETEKQWEKLYWQKEHLQNELKEKQTEYANVDEQLSELDETEAGYLSRARRKQALDLAFEKLSGLSKNVYYECSMELNRRTSEILKEITGGKYSMVFVDEKLKMHLYTGERKVAIEEVSRGTIEQIYFALRMAASEILFEEEYPVILDDTFVFYDDVRLTNTLRWLVNHKKQVLIFTCQKREGEILKKLGVL